MTKRLTWPAVEQVLHTVSAPMTLRFDGSPDALLDIDPKDRRLAVRVPRGHGDVAASPLRHVRIEARSLSGVDWIEVSIKGDALLPYFFGLAVTLADRVQRDGVDPPVAVNECIDRWQDLLRPAPSLSREAEVGLIGELIVLKAMCDVRGPKRALEAWTGPLGEAHDFRFGSTELEVKTTQGEHRRHVISSDTQLVPSPGCDLYVMSVQLAAGGDGATSLYDWIRGLRTRFKGTHRSAFNSRLECIAGLDLDELDRYRSAFRPRSKLYLVKVTDDFPRIQPGLWGQAPQVNRISDVRYRVDVQGLGHEAGTAEFAAIMGEVPDVIGI